VIVAVAVAAVGLVVVVVLVIEHKLFVYQVMKEMKGL
jgi:hypothetical protein